MITVRPAAERGPTRLDWLDSRHSFSFAEYYDPRHMGFRTLRVINEDWVAPGCGFDTHGHRDMEILTYVLDGALQHRDSMGNGAVIRPGEVQVMGAGTGVRHSEFNASAETPVHLLQIWILPDTRGLPPRYDQRDYPRAERLGKFRLVGSKDGRDGALVINQDAAVYAAILDQGRPAGLTLAPGRHAWVQVARGAVTVNGTALAEGDGAAVSGETALTVTATTLEAELLVFDLA